MTGFISTLFIQLCFGHTAFRCDVRKREPIAFPEIYEFFAELCFKCWFVHNQFSTSFELREIGSFQNFFDLRDELGTFKSVHEAMIKADG